MNKTKISAAEKQEQTAVTDYLTDFLRSSARKMLQLAVTQEVEDFIAEHQVSSGKAEIVRNGYLPKRCIKTGIGDIEVSMPRIRNRKANTQVQFASSLVPKYMRRTVTIDVMLPLLYLKGISTNNFKDALSPIFGDDAKNLSANVISRLKSGWYDEYEQWNKQSLSDKQYVYLWADGIYLSARMETEKQCMLVIIGADEHGNKELVGITDGYRESKDSWLELLNDLKERGLNYSPHIAVGDGALGFWGALNEAFPRCKQQRCWVHKTANILDKLPKSQRDKAKGIIHEIYMSANRKDAHAAYKKFIKRYEAKYPKAVNCLTKSENELFTFYDFPAEHWVHLRTTNPIESTFATVRHRTRLSKNCHSRKTIIGCVFKLIMEAEKRWRPLNGKKRITQLIKLDTFIDGINKKDLDKQCAA